MLRKRRCKTCVWFGVLPGKGEEEKLKYSQGLEPVDDPICDHNCPSEGICPICGHDGGEWEYD